MRAIVNKSVCNMFDNENFNVLSNQLLYGQEVNILEFKNKYVQVVSNGYEGLIDISDILILSDCDKFLTSKKVYVRSRSADVLAQPTVQSKIILTLYNGSTVYLTENFSPISKFAKIFLLDGYEGYIRTEFLSEIISYDLIKDEKLIRDTVVKNALFYTNVQYRWGGITHQGIDCSGLTYMSYLLCGIILYRDAKIMDHFPLKEIPFENIERGDLIFFPGHVAMYIENGIFIHSSFNNCGVGFNSFNEKSKIYSEYYKNNIERVGSVFNYLK